MSTVKEPGYFFRDKLYNKKLDWYQELFKGGQNQKYRGESSTYYFKYLPAIQKIKKDLQNPKFIIILRHPIERVISHYLWVSSMGLEHRSFRKAVEYDMKKEFRPGYHIKDHYKFYIQNSFYAKWLKVYIDYFGLENIKIITNENLKKNPLKTINDCFEFLGLTTLEQIEPIQHNETIYRKIPYIDKLILNFLFTVNDKSTYHKVKNFLIPNFIKINYYKAHVLLTYKNTLKTKPQISNADKNWLKSLLTDDIIELKKLLNDNFDEWKDLKEIQ